MLEHQNSKELVGLVYSVALRYKNDFLDFDDLLQEGFLGLQKAYKNFDPSMNVSFHTYAYYWIKKQILDYVRKYKKLETLNLDEVEHSKLKYEEKFELDVNFGEINFDKCNLSDLERKIVIYNFYEKKPFKEIAVELSLSTERVRQLYKKALRKIKINKKLTNDLSKINF